MDTFVDFLKYFGLLFTVVFFTWRFGLIRNFRKPNKTNNNNKIIKETLYGFFTLFIGSTIIYYFEKYDLLNPNITHSNLLRLIWHVVYVIIAINIIASVFLLTRMISIVINSMIYKWVFSVPDRRLNEAQYLHYLNDMTWSEYILNFNKPERFKLWLMSYAFNKENLIYWLTTIFSVILLCIIYHYNKIDLSLGFDHFFASDIESVLYGKKPINRYISLHFLGFVLFAIIIGFLTLTSLFLLIDIFKIRQAKLHDKLYDTNFLYYKAEAMSMKGEHVEAIKHLKSLRKYAKPYINIILEARVSFTNEIPVTKEIGKQHIDEQIKSVEKYLN